MTEKTKEAIRRQGNRVRHLAECDDCTVHTDETGILSPVFCMSGSIMAGHMVKSLKDATQEAISQMPKVRE